MSCIRLASSDLPVFLCDWAVLGATGFPRYWATVYAILNSGRFANSHLGTRLSIIDSLYEHSDTIFGEDSLDRLISDLRLDDLTVLLQSYFAVLSSRALRSGKDMSRRWEAAVGFVTAFVDELGRRNGHDRGSVFRQQLTMTGLLYSQLRPSSDKSKHRRIRALPASVVMDLYEIFNPNSPRNPFRSEEARWRWYTIFLLLLHQGIRRGEALLLKPQSFFNEIDLRLEERIHWMNVREEQYYDKRRDKPTLKTAHSNRQIPVSGQIVEIVEHYANEFRGKQDHPFLFRSSRDRQSSLHSVNYALSVISKALSPSALADLRTRNSTDRVTPHDLRHTCAVVRLAAFIDDGQNMDLALQNLRVFFGWSEKSKMPLHYSRAYFADRLNTVWLQKMDLRTEALRSIGRIEDHAGIIPHTGDEL